MERHLSEWIFKMEKWDRNLVTYSGAIMVIGLKYGDGSDYKATAYPKAAEFMDRFKEKNASYVCRDILGCDISSEEGMLYARENGFFQDICPRMVESAVDILEEMGI